MAMLSFFSRLFRRKKKDGPSREELLWQELTVPEDIEPVDKKLLAALAGKADLLTAETALADFIACGWPRIKGEVYAFAVGKKICVAAYLKQIVKAFPDEAAELAALCFEKMPPEQRFIFLSVVGTDDPEKVAAEVAALAPQLEGEELNMAFALLGACPSSEGDKLLSTYLTKDDWRLRMKAATALAQAKATAYIPHIRAAAQSCDSVVAAGLTAIAERMEEA